MAEGQEREPKMYNKIVRDRIPEIIEANGSHAETETVEKPEIDKLLRTKLVEEAAEVQEADEEHLKDELADILEVVHALAATNGLTLEEIETHRLQKREERGGFTKGIKLISTH